MKETTQVEKTSTCASQKRKAEWPMSKKVFSLIKNEQHAS